MKQSIRNPHPKMKWVILIELAICCQLLILAAQLGPCQYLIFNCQLCKYRYFEFLWNWFQAKTNVSNWEKVKQKFKEPNLKMKCFILIELAICGNLLILATQLGPCQPLIFNCQQCKYCYFQFLGIWFQTKTNVSNWEKVTQNLRNSLDENRWVLLSESAIGSQ